MRGLLVTAGPRATDGTAKCAANNNTVEIIWNNVVREPGLQLVRARRGSSKSV